MCLDDDGDKSEEQSKIKGYYFPWYFYFQWSREHRLRAHRRTRARLRCKMYRTVWDMARSHIHSSTYAYPDMSDRSLASQRPRIRATHATHRRLCGVLWFKGLWDNSPLVTSSEVPSSFDTKWINKNKLKKKNQPSFYEVIMNISELHQIFDKDKKL